MEAQLIDTSFEQSLAVIERSLARQDDNRVREEALAARLDAYLRAAGAEDEALRRHLRDVARDILAARDLAGTAARRMPTWAEIIAATDSCLAAAACGDNSGAEAQSARGRVALQLGSAVAAQAAEDWGTPPRRRRRMRTQSLSLWRPHLQDHTTRLFRYQIRPSARGLAAGLCWLAVLFIP